MSDLAVHCSSCDATITVDSRMPTAGTLAAGWTYRGTQLCCPACAVVVTETPPAPAAHRPKPRLRRVREIAVGLAPIIAGVVAGVLVGTRAFHVWTAFARSTSRGPGPHADAQLPTSALVFFGVIFIVGGLVQLSGRLQRKAGDHNVAFWHGVFDVIAPSRRSGPMTSLEGWLVAREQRRRDSSTYRSRTAMLGLGAGVTVIVCAALR